MANDDGNKETVFRHANSGHATRLRQRSSFYFDIYRIVLKAKGARTTDIQEQSRVASPACGR